MDMGDKNLPLFQPEFNRYLKIESRPERLSSEAGAVIGREVIERLGIVKWLTERLRDPRDPDLITHPLPELLHTSLLLLAQGWRDQDDADALRDDPVMRLSVSTRRGVAPLQSPAEDSSADKKAPDGLASQPTLSRLTAALSSERNRAVLRSSLLETASRRLRAMRGGSLPRYLSIDVDSIPLDVYGHQPGSEYNGHYHGRIYHPLVALCAETGDLLDAKLRPGNVHTADGGLEFILPLIDEVEKKLCQVASVRIDAGFPEDGLLSALEERGVGYVARIKNNPVLDKMADPYLHRPPGRPPAEGRTWFVEMSYRAESWPRARRVVLVVCERPGELFLDYFWLITNWPEAQMDAEALLELYRERGTGEGHLGELKSVLEPALSSSPRPKNHYRGEAPKKRSGPCDAFAHNEAILLLNALAYNIVHTARVLLEQATGQGWSLKRVRERVLKAAARVLVHGRYVTMVIAPVAARLWRALWKKLSRLKLAPAPG
jgi:hypothetical protein